MVSEVRLWLDFKNDCIVCLRNASYLVSASCFALEKTLVYCPIMLLIY